MLDLRYNRKCGKLSAADLLKRTLPGVDTRLTITEVGLAQPEGTFVGNAPADRDATLLRAQLEPLGTLILRRRLERDFAQPPTDPEAVPRASVMQQLLECYEVEGINPDRPITRVAGKPVSVTLCSELLVELREWKRNHKKYHRNQQERPSIKAGHYMILRSPHEYHDKHAAGSRRARLAAVKNENNGRLWRLAAQAMMEVDPEFAILFTALAVTCDFRY